MLVAGAVAVLLACHFRGGMQVVGISEPSLWLRGILTSTARLACYHSASPCTDSKPKQCKSKTTPLTSLLLSIRRKLTWIAGKGSRCNVKLRDSDALLWFLRLALAFFFKFCSSAFCFFSFLFSFEVEHDLLRYRILLSYLVISLQWPIVAEWNPSGNRN